MKRLKNGKGNISTIIVKKKQKHNVKPKSHIHLVMIMVYTLSVLPAKTFKAGNLAIKSI